MLDIQKIKLSDLFILMLGLIGLSSAPIFIRISEQEIGPFATIFDRACIASIVLWMGHAVSQVSNSNRIQNMREKLTPKLFMLLLSSSACGATTFWQLSVPSLPKALLLSILRNSLLVS